MRDGDLLTCLASIASYLNSDDEDVVLTRVLRFVREVGVELLGGGADDVDDVGQALIVSWL